MQTYSDWYIHIYTYICINIYIYIHIYDTFGAYVHIFKVFAFKGNAVWFTMRCILLTTANASWRVDCRCAEHMKRAPTCLTHPGPAGCVEAVARAPWMVQSSREGVHYGTLHRKEACNPPASIWYTLWIYLLNYLESCAMYTIISMIWRSDLRPMKLLNPSFWRVQQHFLCDKSRRKWNGFIEKTWKVKMKRRWRLA